MATRALYYFKLNKRIRIFESVTGFKPDMFISGTIRRRRSSWLPAFLDEEVALLTKTYNDTSMYGTMLLELENEAFKLCEEWFKSHNAIQEMLYTHKTNLKKLNAGYKLLSWFKGLGWESKV